ncbi:MAG: hypothetical protein LBT11_04630 [Treponema sp.]|jgi:hypothetical protein|nr:hypothetical protein [Treponema sp.]
MSTDWLPTKEQDLVDLVKQWSVTLADTAKQTAFGWAPEDCTAVLGKITDFTDARAGYQADKTPEKRLDKDEAVEAVKEAMRGFANSSIRFNKKMSDAEKLALGIHPKDSTHSPKPKPAEHVAFVLRVDAQGHAVWADYRIAEGAGRGKGPYHGVEIRLWVLPLAESAPVGAEHPGWRSEVDTATPWHHDFAEAEVGMRLHVTMRWENPSVGKGEDPESSKGPWCAVQSVVIA